jgi:hypothetical protein
MILQKDRFLDIIEPTLVAYRLSGYSFEMFENINFNTELSCFSFEVTRDGISKRVITVNSLSNASFGVTGRYSGHAASYSASCRGYRGLPTHFVKAMTKLGV